MNNPEAFQSDAEHASAMPTGLTPSAGKETSHEAGAIRTEVDRAKAIAASTMQTTVEQAKNEASHAKNLAEQKIGEVRGRARSAAQTIVNDKKRQISGQLGLVTEALNRTSEKLHSDQNSSFAQYTEMAAEKVESIRHSIESKDVGDLMDDVQSFARRQPALVFGGLFVAGLAAMRFMKASSQQSTERELQRVAAQTEEARRTGRTLTPQQASVVSTSENFPPSM